MPPLSSVRSGVTHAVVTTVSGLPPPPSSCPPGTPIKREGGEVLSVDAPNGVVYALEDDFCLASFDTYAWGWRPHRQIGHKSNITSVCMCGSVNVVVSGDAGGTGIVWSSVDQRRLFTFAMHSVSTAAAALRTTGASCLSLCSHLFVAARSPPSRSWFVFLPSFLSLLHHLLCNFVNRGALRV